MNLKLLIPGIKIKRWFLSISLGMFLISLIVIIKLRSEIIYVLSMINQQAINFSQALGGPVFIITLQTAIFIIGIILIFIGAKRLRDTTFEALPESHNLINIIYKKAKMEKQPKIVVLGGGSGRFTLLQGLKKITSNTTAVVSMADSGGSTGVLREELDTLPPGDVRQCIVALSRSSTLLERLFQYRFEKGTGLKGHSFGNLLITAMAKITGSFEEAVKETSRILKIEGRVLPVTTTKTHLYAELENGQLIRGEANIDVPKHDPKLKIKRVFLKPSAKPVKETLEAIYDADIIVLGPGDIYTSVIPNILVEEMADAIRMTKAKKVYVCNIMTKYGESNNFSVLDFVKEIEKYLGHNVLDYVIFNTQKPSDNMLERYAKNHSKPVSFDLEEMKNHHSRFIPGQLIFEDKNIRHDPDKLASMILKLKR